MALEPQEPTLARRIRNSSQFLGLVLSLCSAAAGADVVAVVSSKSTITALSANQVADIFFGRIRRFPNGALAVPVDLNDGSIERDRFYAKIAGQSPAQVKSYWSKIIFTGRGQPPRTVMTDIDMKKYISANVAAIGYIDESMVDASVRVLN
jgi:ABC-type phosphate transport system substrate-binding protein